MQPAAAPDAAIPASARPSQSGLPPYEAILAASDLQPDPALRIGRLPNGMTYVIRHNETPAGTAEVRLRFDTGSLDESAAEQGYAHYVEHMAFNGSTNVPEGEMVALLERKGLAFGADTNASTGFDATIYKLSLPTNTPDLLDTALMLMRETAGELLFDDEAVQREKGIILSERRDRSTYQLLDLVDRFAFEAPDATYPDRLPIGTLETLNAANGKALRAYWERNYRPELAVLTVVGDYPVDAVEAQIKAKFSDWQAKSPSVPQRAYGTVDLTRAPAEDIYIHPALPERVTATRQGQPQVSADTSASRRKDVLRWIGYAIVNRRLKRLTRQDDPPFKSAGIGTSDMFRMGRISRLVVDTPEGQWKRGLEAAVAEYRRALAGGFSEAEVAEQLAKLMTAQEDAAAGEATRTNAALTGEILNLFEEGEIPTLPSASLERLRAMQAEITPDAVLAALKAEMVPLDDAMLRYSGRTEPEGGTAALRAAWNEAMDAPLADTAPPQVTEFAYTDFGPAGTVVSDERDPVYDIRRVTFANNVHLNIKQTDLAEDQVIVRVSLDGGDLLNTRENPLATELVSSLPAGGLGEHSADELETILAGRNVGARLGASGEVFTSTRTTTPRDLGLQLQLIAAYLTDPGYRSEAISAYRRQLPDRFARMDATPNAALATRQMEILSDKDPRYTIQPIEAYEALDFADLREAVADRLAKGAIEIGIVGSIDEDEAIAMVARTIGALPAREPAFLPRTDARQRTFTATRGPVFVRHGGQQDQAVIRYFFPTTDDSDAALTARLELLQSVVDIALTEELRERLGQAYSPGVASSMSQTYPGFGIFLLNVGVDLSQVAPSVEAIEETMRKLRDEPIPADLVQRARQPMLDKYDNALKSNAGWLGLVDRAQSRGDRLARFAAYRGRLESITPAELQQAARKWLPAGGAVEMIAIPEGVSEPDL
ncbi:M16 family metallopeptidase [Croceicoccus pelagius]|uniref:Peptidase M16 n=1 Tax=Croceicoccus pelagius TaxID=1703341 RepID=A0A916YHQ3_9SPHN|nr:M16 family metallopeptidase [Croceicoccus pelagius]GGD45510.1 peptidase M16 [Croceicoccus pelagius]